MIKGIGEAVRTAKAENIKDSAAVIKKEEEKKAKEAKKWAKWMNIKKLFIVTAYKFS